MIRDALWLFGELLVLFLGVSFGLALLRRRLGDDRLRSLMGASPIKAALRGIMIGFITPFCTYSAIPVLVSLRQAGVPPAGYVAFISWPHRCSTRSCSVPWPSSWAFPPPSSTWRWPSQRR